MQGGRSTPPSLLRNATAPSRGGLGKKAGLYAMPRAPLLVGAVAAGDWGVKSVSCCWSQTPPSSLRDATAPNRGGLGKEVRLCEMPRAPLLAGAVAARRLGGCPTKKRPHHSKEQWGRFTILQWVPLTQPWGLREPLPPQPLRRALPERQERQRASEPASPRAWGDSDRPSAGRG